jgi:hypothetical protein
MFLVMAFKQWQGRPQPGEEAAMPTWMSTVDAVAPGKALVLGAALSGANPKNLALTVSMICPSNPARSGRIRRTEAVTGSAC